MSETRAWPSWSKWFVLFLLVGLGAILVSQFVAIAAPTAWGRAMLNVVIATLGLASAAALAAADAMQMTRAEALESNAKVARAVGLVGHACLIASVGYLVALAWTAFSTTPL